MEIFDLRLPQKSLGQGSIPKYVTESQINTKVILALIHRMLAGAKSTRQTALWASPTAALVAFSNACGLTQWPTARIASWRPTSIAIAPTQTLVELSRDAADWREQDLEGCDLLLLPNPSLWDGYFLPQEMLEHALTRIHELRPELPIVIDERNLVFSWEDLAPAEAMDLEIKNPHLILGSTHPILAPNLSSEIAWTHSDLSLATDESALDVRALQEAHFMISSFKTKQGPFAQEFQKVMLVVRESLKRLSNELQLMAKDMNFRISLWPTCGSYLTLHCANELDANRLIQTFQQHEVIVLSGRAYGDPAAVMLSYSMHLSQCDRLLKRLTEIRDRDTKTISAPLA